MIRFRLVDKEPILINVFGKDYRFPRFLRKDWIAWRAEEMQKRTEAATEGMDSDQRARVLMMYPPQPLTNQEMRRLVYTPEGSGRVYETCAKRAGVPQPEIDRVIKDGDVDEMDIECFAVMLASMASPDDMARQMGIAAESDKDPKRHKEADAETEIDDPLAPASSGSVHSPATAST